MRVDDVRPADMNAEQLALYETYSTGRRAAPDSPFSLVAPDGRLQGPPAVWVLSPVFGQALQTIGSTVRWDSRLPYRAREIAVLLVGHHHRSAFELYAHTRAGRAAGLTDEDLAALSTGEDPAGLSAAESAVLTATRRMLAAGTLTTPEFDAAASALGADGLFELVTIVGYYTMVALQLAVFDVRPA